MTEAVGDTGHTDFMTPEEREQRNDSLSGSYVGIGVRIDPTTRACRASSACSTAARPRRAGSSRTT